MRSWLFLSEFHRPQFGPAEDIVPPSRADLLSNLRRWLWPISVWKWLRATTSVSSPDSLDDARRQRDLHRLAQLQWPHPRPHPLTGAYSNAAICFNQPSVHDHQPCGLLRQSFATPTPPR